MKGIVWVGNEETLRLLQLTLQVGAVERHHKEALRRQFDGDGFAVVDQL